MQHSASTHIQHTHQLLLQGVVSHNQCLFTGLSVDISAEDLKYALEGIAGMGQVRVNRKGTCRRPKWMVEWLTEPGDQPLIQVRLLFCHYFIDSFRQYWCIAQKQIMKQIRACDV